MRWFLDLTTRTKLFLGFGLMILFLMTVIATAYTNITAIRDAQQRLYNEEFANATELLSLRSNLNGVRAALLDMVIITKRSDQEAWHQEIKDRSQQASVLLQRLLERNQRAPTVLRRLEGLNTIYATFVQTRDSQIIPLIYAGKIEEAKTLLLGIQKERYSKIRVIATELGDEAEQNAKVAVMQSEQQTNESVRIFVIIGFIGLLLGVLMVVFLNRIIANPLGTISKVAERVASGDLTVNVPSDDRADEVGALTQTFRRMVENLRTVNREIQEGVNVLGSSASEILASTTQVAAGAAETATAISETTTTVEETKQTTQVASQKAKYVSESAGKAVQVSQTGMCQ